jgi:hypothetical protein
VRFAPPLQGFAQAARRVGARFIIRARGGQGGTVQAGRLVKKGDCPRRVRP